MSADKEFVQLREGETVTIGHTLVSNLSLYHPGTAYAYRFDDGESVFVFASDGEYKSLTDAHLRRYISFFAGADALVFDAQYSLRDVFLSKADWGHSSAIIGVDIAERSRVKKLITFHHDPTHTDEQIHATATAARDCAPPAAGAGGAGRAGASAADLDDHRRAIPVGGAAVRRRAGGPVPGARAGQPAGALGAGGGRRPRQPGAPTVRGGLAGLAGGDGADPGARQSHRGSGRLGGLCLHGAGRAVAARMAGAAAGLAGPVGHRRAIW